MKKSTALVVFGSIQVLFILVAFVSGYVVRAATAAGQPVGLPLLDAQTPDSYPLLAEVRGLLKASFIGPLPDEQTLEYGAVRGLVTAVGDPYTVFVEPQHHELDTQSLSGEYGGVGMTISGQPEGTFVLSPYRDSPAAQAGVQEGDVLLQVDNTEIVAGLAMDAVTSLIRGPIGSTVVLVVRHPDGAQERLSVTRQRYEIPSVRWKLLDGHANIGLITVDRFSDKTAAEVGLALAELSTQGANRYVLDLRNNGGGILEAAVDVTGHFLNGGVVMYETQSNAPEKIYTAPGNDGPATAVPLAVLVNHNTASAAEIVAGALLDRDRAALIGQQTYGKGSVQLVYDLSDGSSLHVTAYRWYTPKRRELEEGGLPPTFVVEPAIDGTDSELARAIEYLDNLGQVGADEAASMAGDDGTP
jgi:carboxyl-terminal processing protease